MPDGSLAVAVDDDVVAGVPVTLKGQSKLHSPRPPMPRRRDRVLTNARNFCHGVICALSLLRAASTSAQ